MRSLGGQIPAWRIEKERRQGREDFLCFKPKRSWRAAASTWGPKRGNSSVLIPVRPETHQTAQAVQTIQLKLQFSHEGAESRRNPGPRQAGQPPGRLQ